jgi:hypothetical protein
MVTVYEGADGVGTVGAESSWLAGPQADDATQMARTIPIENTRMSNLVFLISG